MMIAKNAGVDASLVVEKVLRGEDLAYGYDAFKDEYVDMIKTGMSEMMYLLLASFLLG